MFVKLYHPDELDATPQIVGVYKKKPDHAVSNESIQEFELQ